MEVQTYKVSKDSIKFISDFTEELLRKGPVWWVLVEEEDYERLIGESKSQKQRPKKNSRKKGERWSYKGSHSVLKDGRNKWHQRGRRLYHLQVVYPTELLILVWNDPPIIKKNYHIKMKISFTPFITFPHRTSWDQRYGTIIEVHGIDYPWPTFTLHVPTPLLF